MKYLIFYVFLHVGYAQGLYDASKHRDRSKNFTVESPVERNGNKIEPNKYQNVPYAKDCKNII